MEISVPVFLDVAAFPLIGVVFQFGEAHVVSAAASPLASSGFRPRTGKESSAANYPRPARSLLPHLGTGPPLYSAPIYALSSTAFR